MSPVLQSTKRTGLVVTVYRQLEAGLLPSFLYMTITRRSIVQYLSLNFTLLKSGDCLDKVVKEYFYSKSSANIGRETLVDIPELASLTREDH